jgi:hypothetical protein
VRAIARWLLRFTLRRAANRSAPNHTRMAAPAEPDADSVNAHLAEFLCSRKEEVIRSWMGRVQADPTIPAESLTTNQLRDNLPRLFDDLADTILRYGSEDVADRTAKDAEKHGAERWHQGFELPQLLREIMHLRTIFIFHLRIFEEQHAEFGTAARLYAHSTVHQFLDELGMDATEQFLASDKQARRTGSGIAQ